MPPPSDQPSASVTTPQPTHPVAEWTVTDEALEFRWTLLPDVDAYRLQIAASESFETIYHDKVVDGPTVVELADVLPDDVVAAVWRVRAEGDEETPWSTPAAFAVSDEDPDDEAEFLVDAPPVPVRPIQGDAVDPEGATLTWDGVPEASGYRVQVSDADSFEEPSVDLTLGHTPHLTLHEHLSTADGTLFWRVRALFPNGTEGPWSETVQFDAASVPAAEAELAAEGDEPAGEAPSLKQSPVAAGPARRSYTSDTMAFTFIAVLLVSFFLTIVLIMWAV